MTINSFTHTTYSLALKAYSIQSKSFMVKFLYLKVTLSFRPLGVQKCCYEHVAYYTPHHPQDIAQTAFLYGS